MYIECILVRTTRGTTLIYEALHICTRLYIHTYIHVKIHIHTHTPNTHIHTSSSASCCLRPVARSSSTRLSNSATNCSFASRRTRR